MYDRVGRLRREGNHAEKKRRDVFNEHEGRSVQIQMEMLLPLASRLLPSYSHIPETPRLLLQF